MSICDRNCFACQFEDCICDELEYQDYLMLDSLEKEIIHPKTAQRRKAAARQKAYRESNKEKIKAQKKAYYEVRKKGKGPVGAGTPDKPNKKYIQT
jgi:hypothetical protein